MNIKGTIKYLVSRADGFINHMSGWGGRRDKGEKFYFRPERRLSRYELDNLYADHELAWKVVDLLPDNALRKWIDINHEQGPKVLLLLKQIGLRNALNEALKMARLHGGSAIFLDIDDGGLPSEPVVPYRVKGIRGCHVIDRYYLQPKEARRTLRHEMYQLGSVDNPSLTGVVDIHHSRLLLFYGRKASRDWMIANNGWGVSIVNQVARCLTAYSVTHGVVPNIAQDFIQGVLKMQGLNTMDFDSEEDQKKFDNRLDAMMVSKSTINELLIDKEDEYARHTTNVSGLNDLIRNPERRLVAATGMPHTVLLGETPGGGINAGKGDSQEKDWNKATGAFQEEHVRPPIEYVLELVAPIFKAEELPFEFCPLDVPSEKERAEVYKLASEADKNYSEIQALSPQQIARNAFGGPVFSLQRTVGPDEIEEPEELDLEDSDPEADSTDPLSSDS